jgi:hypothetical protein
MKGLHPLKHWGVMVSNLSRGMVKKCCENKAISVTGLGDLQGCQMLRIPHCLDNRLTDGGKVRIVLALLPRNIFSVPIFISVPEFLATDSESRVRFPPLPEKKVVGLERGSLSLVSTTEELLDRKVAAPV